MSQLALIILYTIAALLFCCLVFSAVFFKMFALRRGRSADWIKTVLLKKKDIKAEWLELGWETASLTSRDGTEIALHSLAGTQPKLAVFMHGISWNWFASLKFASIFWRRGWSVVCFDARGHGGSGGRGSTFGFREKDDIDAVLEWAGGRFAHDKGLVLFGVSLGAASVIEYAGEYACAAPENGTAAAEAGRPGAPRALSPAGTPRSGTETPCFASARGPLPDAFIADCPYSDLSRAFSARLRDLLVLPPLRPIVILFVDLWCRIFAGFSVRGIKPVESVVRTDRPMLFVHGLEDSYVSPLMSQEMAKKRKAQFPSALTELYLVPGAGHARACRTNPAAYEEALCGFLDRAGIKAGD